MPAFHGSPVSVVTGGAGFLGSHLVDRLLADGHRVIAVDNLVTGSEQNLAHLKGRNDFSWIQGDICEGLDVEGPVQFVWNCASPASPVDYMELPIETLRAGSEGTRNALEHARRKGARFLQTSTSEVYGDPLVHPQPESYWGHVNPVGPRSCYDESKRFAEAIVIAYHRTHGVETRIVRIFNTYGPRMRLRDGRVVPNFIRQALAGEPLTIFGDGRQTRSFCYCQDLIDGIVRLMHSSEVFPVNIGNPAELTMIQFAAEILRITGSNSGMVHRPLPQDDPRQRQPDITRARKILGWHPKTDLAEGLQATIEYFRKVSQ